ncbi:MAG: hypothetical protein ACFB0A_10860 [Croceivirga sp.]
MPFFKKEIVLFTVKTKTVVFPILFFLALYAFGQKEEISVQRLEENIDTSLVKKRYFISEKFREFIIKDLDSAELYRNKLTKLPTSADTTIAKELFLNSTFYYQRKELDSSFVFAEKAIRKVMDFKNDSLRVKTLVDYTVASTNSNKLQDFYLSVSEKQLREKSDTVELIDFFFLVGSHYYIKQEYVDALPFLSNVDS